MKLLIIFYRSYESHDFGGITLRAFYSINPMKATYIYTYINTHMGVLGVMGADQLNQ